MKRKKYYTDRTSQNQIKINRRNRGNIDTLAKMYMTVHFLGLAQVLK